MTAQQSSRFPRGDPTIAYDVAKERLATQLAQIDGLDAKLANAVGFGSALVTIVAAFLALKGEDLARVPVCFLSAAGVVYTVLMCVSLWAYRIRKWDFGPDLTAVWNTADQYDERALTWTVAEATMNAYRANKDAVETKATLAALTVALLASESILMVVGLLSTLS
jgi:hypothetical protein